jgi:hypothetical protein
VLVQVLDVYPTPPDAFNLCVTESLGGRVVSAVDLQGLQLADVVVDSVHVLLQVLLHV